MILILVINKYKIDQKQSNEQQLQTYKLLQSEIDTRLYTKSEPQLSKTNKYKPSQQLVTKQMISSVSKTYPSILLRHNLITSQSTKNLKSLSNSLNTFSSKYHNSQDNKPAGQKKKEHKATKKQQPSTLGKPKFLQKIQTLRSMKQYFIPFLHKDKRITYYLLKSYGFLLLGKLCFFGGPLFLKHGINALQVGAQVGMINPIYMFAGYGFCYSASVMFESLRNLQSVRIVNIALTETASNAYRHMLSLGPQFFFSGSQRHKLFNLFKAQQAIEQNLKSFTQYFMPIAVDISLSTAMLYYYSGSPFVISFLTCYGLYTAFTLKYSDYRHTIIKQFRGAERKLDFITSQTFANYYNVKYFQKQQHELQKYRKQYENYYNTLFLQQKSLGVLNTAQRFIFGFGLTFNIMLAAFYTQQGIMSTGDIIMIQTLMMQFLNPLFFLGSMYRSFTDTFVDVRQLRNTLALPVRVKQGTQKLSNIRGNIKFNNVSFKYIDQQNQVIQNLNFQIKQNSFVAIMGQSGAGKSTILNLIFRLYDPFNGQIQIDGIDIKTLKFDFRKQISFVSQSPYLFNGTVLENLKFGNPDAKFEEIQELAIKFNIHATIAKLPNGYNTNVGQKGNIFSGGEKQRISLIRALLKKSKILLLDEPTSSLDLQTERKIAQALRDFKNCTRVMITHREGLLKYCDDVIVIQKLKQKREENEQNKQN